MDSSWNVKYDAVMDGVRVARVGIAGFDVVFTRNTNMPGGKCTVHVAQKTPMHPEIQFSGDGFTMSYGYIVLDQADVEGFEEAWKDAVAFCRDGRSTVAECRRRIEAGERL